MVCQVEDSGIGTDKVRLVTGIGTSTMISFTEFLLLSRTQNRIGFLSYVRGYISLFSLLFAIAVTSERTRISMIQFVENPRGPILTIEVRRSLASELLSIEASKQGVLSRMQRIKNGQKGMNYIHTS